MTSEGLGEMFEGDSADTCAEIFPLVLMGGRAEGLACAVPGVRTPIGPSGICYISLSTGGRYVQGRKEHVNQSTCHSFNTAIVWLDSLLQKTSIVQNLALSIIPNMWWY